MLGLRLPELLLILAVVLIVFGANKLPQLGAGLGQGIKSFKRAFRDASDEEAVAPKESPEAKAARDPAGPPPK